MMPLVNHLTASSASCTIGTTTNHKGATVMIRAPWAIALPYVALHDSTSDLHHIYDSDGNRIGHIFVVPETGEYLARNVTPIDTDERNTPWATIDDAIHAVVRNHDTGAFYRRLNHPGFA